MRTKLESHLEKNLDRHLVNLEEMVGQNSFTLNREGVRALGRVTADQFAALGFSAEFVPAADNRFGDHLFLSRGRHCDRGILLVSHLDTVFPEAEERRNNFAWRKEGSRIYGPGTVDIKGGTALIAMMLDALSATQPELFQNTHWLIALNAAEEHGERDFSPLCRERAPKKTLGCLVFEGGNVSGETFLLVTARKGRAEFRIEVEGRGAHSGGRHQRGANAIRQLAQVIEKLEGLTNYEKTLTCNVGMIGGGEALNRVPHHAWAEGEFRAFDEIVFREAETRILELDGSSSVRSPDDSYACKVKVKTRDATLPWPKGEASEKLFSVWASVASEFGWKVAPEARGGLSDANRLWQDFPTLDGLGPLGANSHCSESSEDGSKDQEYVDADSFVPKALLNTLAVMKLLQSSR